MRSAPPRMAAGPACGVPRISSPRPGPAGDGDWSSTAILRARLGVTAGGDRPLVGIERLLGGRAPAELPCAPPAGGRQSSALGRILQQLYQRPGDVVLVARIA